MEIENPTTQRLRILLLEDDTLFREQIEKYLGVYNDLGTAGNLSEARDLLKKERFDVVILDKHLPDGSGLDLIAEIRAEHPATVILVLTSDPNLNLVRRCLDAGASDYLQKSENILPELLIRLPLAIRNAALKRHNEALEQKLNYSFRYEIVGHSPETEMLRRAIEECADSNAPVLIIGESGTGKELVARRINALKHRGRKFVAVNCGAIPEQLVESELFGHMRGSFTNAHQDKIGLFEQADGGDLFLDEIGELPLATQAKLLRVLQEGELRRVGDNRTRRVRVRIIAATNRSLEEMVKVGAFREDLYYRLNVFLIQTPPLRERPSDVPDLARYFLDQLTNGRIKMSDEAGKMLSKLPWPGNIRELRNTVERAVLSATRRGSATVDRSDLSFLSRSGTSPSRELSHLPGLPKGREDLTKGAIEAFMRSCEKAFLTRAFELCEGNQTKIAAHLGLGRTTLFRKASELGLGRAKPGLKTNLSSENTKESLEPGIRDEEQA